MSEAPDLQKEEVEVTVWKPAYHKIQTVEDVVSFLQEMGLQCVTAGPTTLESIGRNPEWWVEAE